MGMFWILHGVQCQRGTTTKKERHFLCLLATTRHAINVNCALCLSFRSHSLVCVPSLALCRNNTLRQLLFANIAGVPLIVVALPFLVVIVARLMWGE